MGSQKGRREEMNYREILELKLLGLGVVGRIMSPKLPFLIPYR